MCEFITYSVPAFHYSLSISAVVMGIVKTVYQLTIVKDKDSHLCVMPQLSKFDWKFD